MDSPATPPMVQPPPNPIVQAAAPALRTTTKQQSQLLLVALLENFCSLYDRNPRRHRRLFYRICQQLAANGLIDAEDFLDGRAPLRSVYKQAFRELVARALQDIKRDPAYVRRIAYPSELAEEDTDESTETFSSTEESEDSIGDRRLYQNFLSPRSRYQEEFTEVRVLGRGAYGVVVQARNKLDGVDYAIKRIRLQFVHLTSHEKVLREARYLAALQHPNIVRYHASWLELEEWPNDTSGRTTRQSAHQLENSRETLSFHRHPLDFPSVTRHLDDFIVEFAPSNENNVGITRLSLSSEATSHREPTVEPQSPNTVQRPVSPLLLTPRNLTLYIQMHLCSWTLREWLDARNEAILNRDGISSFAVDIFPAENLQIFRGIVDATVYLHSRNLIHRDLKPSNIFFVPAEDSHSINLQQSTPLHPSHFRSYEFLRQRWVPKLGDFGLVTRQDLDLNFAKLTFGEQEEDEEANTARWNHTANAWNLERESDLDAINIPESTKLEHSAPKDIPRSHRETDGISLQPKSVHTSDVGTAMYAAPEQLSTPAPHQLGMGTATTDNRRSEPPPSTIFADADTSAYIYDAKVDVFALGVILLELFLPFATTMERVQTLHDLRVKRMLPASFVQRWPREAKLILDCTDPSPSRRPTAQELQRELWGQAKGPEDPLLLHSELHWEVARLRQENERLRELLRQHQIPLPSDIDHTPQNNIHVE